jgi:5'-nucleotidase
MRILVSNDDGIYSPGIAALATAASRFGVVRIVAPDVEQSSMGHAITSNRPLRYKRVAMRDFEAYRVNGTPADCVALGLHFWGGADLVLSGINLGTNLGSSTWHSGTLAAAKQAVLLGVRGIALSTPADDEEPDFERLQPHVEEVLKLVIHESPPQLLNINIPANSRGILWTHQSLRRYDGKMVRDTDPMGREHFWFTVVPIKQSEEGTDRWAVETGRTSITPLRLDLTDESELKRMNSGDSAKIPAQTEFPARPRMTH